jgi:hypothetical protein
LAVNPAFGAELKHPPPQTIALPGSGLHLVPPVRHEPPTITIQAVQGSDITGKWYVFARARRSPDRTSLTLIGIPVFTSWSMMHLVVGIVGSCQQQFDESALRAGRLCGLGRQSEDPARATAESYIAQ